MPTITLPTRDLKSTNKFEFQTLNPTRISPRKQVHTDGAGEVVSEQAIFKPDINKLMSFKLENSF